MLPPDVRDWLAADHLVWLVMDAVAEMGLSGGAAQVLGGEGIVERLAGSDQELFLGGEQDLAATPAR